MRSDHIKARFEEVFTLQMGKTPDRKNPALFDGNNTWVSIRDLGEKYISSSNECISDEAAANINIVKKGTVMMSFKLTVGKCAIASKDLYTNEAIMAFNVKDGYEIDSSFLYYYLQNYRWEGANKAVMGQTLNKATISKQIICIPSISIQQNIVSELDKINELIRLKKEQLQDYDKLAQSLFYEMFGDPVENEKGWEVKKLKEFGKVVTGNTPSRKESKYYSEYHIEWIKTDNIVSGKMYATTASEYLSQLGASVGRKVKAGSVLVACIAGSLSSLGRCCIVDREVAFNQQINAIELYSDKANSKYCYWLITLSSKYIQEFATTGMKHIISKTIFEDIELILPPIEIQQNFAQRIELIEKQKAEIKSTIANLETLLASRMQYWFD